MTAANGEGGAGRDGSTAGGVAAPPAAYPAVPDWSAVDRDVHCPLCGYNLRGLAEPRCPECGYAFAWAEILNPKRTAHPYLFEHHPRRNLWSFWRTAVGTLRPGRFWETLGPAMAVRPGRLLTYWVAAALVALIGVLATPAVAGLIEYAEDVQMARGGWAWTATRPAPGYFDAAGFRYAFHRYDGPEYVAWWVVACAWPWATFLALMIFRASMRRARVLTVHVTRAVVYSFDAIVWAGLVLIAFAAVTGVAWLAGVPVPRFDLWAAWLPPLVGLAAAWRLGVAYRRYLRFDHAWGVVVASQVIVALTALVVVVEIALAW